MRLNEHFLQTRHLDSMFYTLSLLWVLFSEIGQLGRLYNGHFDQLFTGTYTSLKSDIAQYLTQVNIITETHSLAYFQDFLDEYPWGIWPSLYKEPTAPKTFSSITNEISLKLDNVLKQYLNDNRDESHEIESNVKADTIKDSSTIDFCWWSLDATCPYRITLPGKYDDTLQIWSPYMSDEFEIITIDSYRLNQNIHRNSQSKIYKIDSYSDWVSLCKRFPLVKSAPYPLADIPGAPQEWVTADLDTAQHVYDAIKLTVRGYFDAAYRLERTIEGTPCLLMGWHPGATIWLNP